MLTPNAPITPIPNTAPAATPSLWNERYEEIDENFAAVNEAVTATQNTASLSFFMAIAL